MNRLQRMALQRLMALNQTLYSLFQDAVKWKKEPEDATTTTKRSVAYSNATNEVNEMLTALLEKEDA